MPHDLWVERISTVRVERRRRSFATCPERCDTGASTFPAMRHGMPRSWHGLAPAGAHGRTPARREGQGRCLGSSPLVRMQLDGAGAAAPAAAHPSSPREGLMSSAVLTWYAQGLTMYVCVLLHIFILTPVPREGQRRREAAGFGAERRVAVERQQVVVLIKGRGVKRQQALVLQPRAAASKGSRLWC